MGDSFNFYTLLALLGCLLAGILFAWLLYGKTDHLDKRLRYVLFAIRTIVIAVTAFILFFPLIRTISYNLEKPLIIIGQDNSMSVGKLMPVGFNKQQYEEDLQKLSSQLSEHYDVKVYSFSDSVKQGFDFSNKGKATNANNFITRLTDELINRNVGAVILSTDGLFNKGGSPLYDVDKLNAPVYTIALGDTVPKKDLLIANVNHNSMVYLDNEFSIEVQVQAFESKGESSRISVKENGKPVYEGLVSINSNPFVKSIPVKLKATNLGLQKYTVQLSPVQNELSEKNNLQHVFIEVIDARQKVLIAASSPHPDVTAIKQTISLNEHYDLKLGIGEELNAINPDDYGLVIAYQMPGSSLNTGVFLGKLGQSKTPVWYIVGAQTNLMGFNQMQKAVSFNGNSSTLQEAFSYIEPNFTAFNLDAAAAKQIENFDPLLSPFGQVVTNGNVSVALSQRIGKIKTGAPQLFYMNDNGRKAGYLIGEGLWKWKLSEAQEEKTSGVFNVLISNTVQYLSVKDDKRKFKVYSAKNTFDENENVLINAVLYNDSYVAVNAPDVNIKVTNEQGKTYNFLFSRTESAYQLDAGTLPPGNYSYTATTVLGKTNHTAKGVFYISELVTEYQQTIANHQLLSTMAKQTNGKMYMPQQLNEILKDITNNEDIKTLSYEDRKYEELINFKWLFAMIVTLLTLEWFFRKRNGEI